MSSFKNPFQFDEFDDHEVIKLEDSEKSVQQPQGFNPYNTQEIPDHDDYQIPINKNGEQHKKTKKKNKQKSSEDSISQLNEDEIILIESGQSENQKSYNNYGNQTTQGELNEDGDPPLLEDIGLQPKLIIQKFLLILKLQTPSVRHIQMTDLAGPILIAFTLGILLMLSGRLQFGNIYALFIIGNLLVCLLFNLMSQSSFISLYSVMSILGYSMLPMLIPGLLSIFITLKNTVGLMLLLAIAMWSSISATSFTEVLLEFSGNNKKGVLMYPIFLYYVSFGIIIMI